MRKALGLFILLLVLSGIAFGWEWSQQGYSNFLTLGNWKNLLNWVGLFGILALAQSIVIITGGIDLSVGSVVGLVPITAALLMNEHEWHPAFALPLSLLIAAAIGIVHGLFITRLRMQPFIVTLCGLFVYRGIARFIAEDKTQGFGIAHNKLRWLGNGSLLDLFPSYVPPPGEPLTYGMRLLSAVAAPLVIMLLLGAVLAAYLHFAAQGRHLFALGANEEAARFSGIRTRRLKLVAYLLCSLITGVGGLLFGFKVNSMGPTDFGSSYELYAIAGAVLGGCSLRGGTGNVLGVILGITLIRVLTNLVNILSIPGELEFVVIGGAILVGVCVDEMLTRRARLDTM